MNSDMLQNLFVLWSSLGCERPLKWEDLTLYVEHLRKPLSEIAEPGHGGDGAEL